MGVRLLTVSFIHRNLTQFIIVIFVCRHIVSCIFHFVVTSVINVIYMAKS